MRRGALKDGPIARLFDRLRLGASDLIPVNPTGFWVPRRKPSRSLRRTAALFDQLGGRTIVEIGTGLHGPLAGNSLVVWTQHTAATRIVAIDRDPHAIAAARTLTTRYPHVETVLDDGLAWLSRCPGPIDLLYLDFWASDPEGSIHGTGRAARYLDAYEAARHALSPNALILIDDTDHVPPWKHTALIPEARRDGYVVIYTGRQTLLRRTTAHMAPS
jgi:predicted O-methyltransferase YrrM